MLADELSELVAELPGVTLASWASTFAAAFGPDAEPATEGNCILAQQIAQQLTSTGNTARPDVILCGRAHLMRRGGLEVQGILLTFDPDRTFVIPPDTVPDRDAVAPSLAEPLAVWLEDPAALEIRQTYPGLTPFPEISDR
jgi:hypothetical protein